MIKKKTRKIPAYTAVRRVTFPSKHEQIIRVRSKVDETLGGSDYDLGTSVARSHCWDTPSPCTGRRSIQLPPIWELWTLERSQR